jgi:REP element-mobilizing transposase RayT
MSLKGRRMSRTARKRSQSGIYHLMLNGINRQMIFQDDEDRARLLETLINFKDVSTYAIFAYCLMDNHVHLLIKQNNESIGRSIKRISGSYVYWFNRKHKRVGHLFQERFKSEVVEDDKYFLNVLRHIHQNPISAGLIKKIGEYQWSSYLDYIGRKHILTDTGFALRMFSDDTTKAMDQFNKFMKESNDNKYLEYEEKNRLLDSEVKKYLLRKGITNISELSQMAKSQRDEIIRVIKLMDGVSIRQISRITGISKSVIDRA